jgi:hypothetical protein
MGPPVLLPQYWKEDDQHRTLEEHSIIRRNNMALQIDFIEHGNPFRITIDAHRAVTGGAGAVVLSCKGREIWGRSLASGETKTDVVRDAEVYARKHSDCTPKFEGRGSHMTRER